jgi:hypothetical protein
MIPQGSLTWEEVGHYTKFSACKLIQACMGPSRHAYLQVSGNTYLLSEFFAILCIGNKPNIPVEENVLLPIINLKATVTENVVKCSF